MKLETQLCAFDSKYCNSPLKNTMKNGSSLDATIQFFC